MDIFVSYSSKDIEIAKNICNMLKEIECSYWVAHENECFGEQYAATIINEIENAKAVIILVSKNSNDSTHVINEINAAVARHKKLFPIILDDVKLSPSMEYYLSSNHYLFMNSPDFGSQFINRVRSLINPQPTPTNVSVTNEPVNKPAPNPAPSNNAPPTNYGHVPNPNVQQPIYTGYPPQQPIFNPQPPINSVQNKPQKKSKAVILIVVIILSVIICVIGAMSDSEKTEIGSKNETQSQSVIEYTKGEVVNGTYKNEWANIQFEIPNGWIDKTNSANLSNTTPTDGLNYEVGLDVMISNETGLEEVFIEFIKLDSAAKMYSDNMFLELFVEGMTEEYDNSGITYTFSGNTTTEIAGEKYITKELNINNSTLIQQVHLLNKGDYVIIIVMSAADNDRISELTNEITTIS